MRVLLESISVALSALRSNPLRAMLTTGGIVIGIFFVLVIGWVLDGLDRSFTDSFAFFGDDVLYVDRFDWSGSVSWAEQRNRPPITRRQFVALEESMSRDAWVVPTISRTADRVQAGTLMLNDVAVFGTTPGYIEMFAGNIAEGRFFSEQEERTASLVAVLGANVAERLFPRGGAVGSTIRVDGLGYHVSGVLPKRGTMLLDFIDEIVYIPISRYTARYGTGSLTISVRPRGGGDLDDVRDETVGAMRTIRSLGPLEENDFGVNSQQMFQEFISTTQAVVWGIGLFLTGLAFVVGAIGIMNIMFVSVTERTKEIGIRKAVGGTRGAILAQFLVESIVLCMIGAVIGLAIAFAVVLFRDQIVAGTVSLLGSLGILEGPVEVDLSFLGGTIPVVHVAVALVVATVVGVAAGIIPAFRASRLAPVDALRAD